MLIKVKGKEKHPSGIATARDEATFDRYADEHFKSQREIPNKRDYMWNYYHRENKTDKQKYRDNFDAVFPNSPGAGI